jgi:S-formylglutathione hydrolase FrmB
VRLRVAGLLALVGTAIVVAVTQAGGHLGAPREGKVLYGSFKSKALDGTDHFSIYLPRGYDSSGKRYPVVYFLHGLPDQPDAYKSIGVVARAIELSGRQAIVVGAQGARKGESDPEWIDHGPGRNWETATAVELVRTIDARYRTLATRSARVLVGISAGGYGAMLIAAHHPTTYSVIESWSGYFHPTNPAGTAPLDLGSEEANDWADFHKLIPQLKTRFGDALARTWFGFYVGTDDSRFRRENEQIYKRMRAAHVPHVVFRLYRGGHSWSLWENHAVDWIGRALGEAAKPR